jgi:hypothetical protein
MNNTADIRYVPSSFSVVGNPYSPNPSVPSGVTAALGPMSDHHPVRLTLEVSQAVSAEKALFASTIQLLGNPVDQELNMRVDVAAAEAGEWHVGFHDLLGRQLPGGFVQNLQAGPQQLSVSTSLWPAGMYWVKLQRPDAQVVMKRFSVVH